MEGLGREQGDMLHVHRRLFVFVPQQQPEGAAGHRSGGRKCHFVLRPFCGGHFHFRRAQHLVLRHAERLAKGGQKADGAGFPRRTRPEGEPVLRPFLQADARPSAVFQPALAGRMAGIAKAHIMRVPVERTALREDFHLAESLPPLQRIVVFEGTVADLFRIQAAVGGEIDVFQKDAVHRRLDGNSRSLIVHNQVRPPRLRRKGRCEEKYGQTERQSLSHFTSHS